MVKKITTINKISNFFLESLKDEDASYVLHLENLLDILINSDFCQSVSLAKADGTIFINRLKNRENELEANKSYDLESYQLYDWGNLTIDKASLSQPEAREFWLDLVDKFSLYLISAEMKLKTRFFAPAKEKKIKRERVMLGVWVMLKNVFKGLGSYCTCIHKED